MTKYEEIANPQSCWNRARPEERLFVLMERDVAFSEAIEHWAHIRVKMGKNAANDPQIVEALKIAEQVRQEKNNRLILDDHPHNEALKDKAGS